MSEELEYIIEEKQRLSLCGISIKLSNSQKKNHWLIKQNWSNFNKALRKNKITLGNSWKKYGVTYQIDSEYYYMCAIESKSKIDVFDSIELPKGKYIKFTHTGDLSRIKNTIHSIYKTHLPMLDIKLNRERSIIHYEYYDYRFNWNNKDSQIDILIPQDLL